MKTVLFLLRAVCAFHLPLPQLRDAPTMVTHPAPVASFSGRRDFAAGLGCVAALVSLPLPTLASGGATSGKTTSIPRAKLRYYNRVTAVVAAFQAMGKDLSGGDFKQAKGFFVDSDSAPFTELKTAGYLLSVAFKIDSKIPPDKIQQVKDFKVLLKDMEKVKSAAAGGKQAEVSTALEKSKTSMNVWLEGVELPPLESERYAV